MKFRASEIARAVGGQLVGPDVEVDEARHDSREVSGGELFVPLVDERDGHDFIDAALAAGASAYFTARAPQGASAIVVSDPAAALAALGAHARMRLDDRVVGVTGSVGKTSCKDLAAAALGTEYETHASLRSFNNEYGVPLTLANAPDGTEATVIEMGARGLGHIAELCEIARPTVGVVTAVELVHTEIFGGLDQVARAKGELIEHLPASGTAVLARSDPLIAAMAQRTHARVLFFGSLDADVRARDVVLDRELRPSFVLESPWGDAPVQLAVRGAHQVHNALAAAAAALACDVTLADVARGLGEAELSPWRMELHTAPSGATVLNDAYNAGPASVEAALRSLHLLEADRHIAVLGPMAELGEHGGHAHRRIATIAADLGIEVLAVGAPDYESATVEHVADRGAVLARLADVGSGVAVLVKGSRVAGLEQIAHALLEP
jgi:UDP-N-acetylmuramoyl-tripeptide--D-alanyl-D-alanine ligase